MGGSLPVQVDWPFHAQRPAGAAPAHPAPVVSELQLAAQTAGEVELSHVQAPLAVGHAAVFL